MPPLDLAVGDLSATSTLQHGYLESMLSEPVPEGHTSRDLILVKCPQKDWDKEQ